MRHDHCADRPSNPQWDTGASAGRGSTRTVDPPYVRVPGARVLPHASQSIDRSAPRTPLIGRTIHGRQLVTGMVLGIARITDCHRDPTDSRLLAVGAPGCLPPAARHVQEVPLPVPARGQVVLP